MYPETQQQEFGPEQPEDAAGHAYHRQVQLAHHRAALAKRLARGRPRARQHAPALRPRRRGWRRRKAQPEPAAEVRPLAVSTAAASVVRRVCAAEGGAVAQGAQVTGRAPGSG